MLLFIAAVAALIFGSQTPPPASASTYTLYPNADLYSDNTNNQGWFAQAAGAPKCLHEAPCWDDIDDDVDASVADYIRLGQPTFPATAREVHFGLTDLTYGYRVSELRVRYIGFHGATNSNQIQLGIYTSGGTLVGQGPVHTLNTNPTTEYDFTIPNLSLSPSTVNGLYLRVWGGAGTTPSDVWIRAINVEAVVDEVHAVPVQDRVNATVGWETQSGTDCVFETTTCSSLINDEATAAGDSDWIQTESTSPGASSDQVNFDLTDVPAGASNLTSILVQLRARGEFEESGAQLRVEVLNNQTVLGSPPTLDVKFAEFEGLAYQINGLNLNESTANALFLRFHGLGTGRTQVASVNVTFYHATTTPAPTSTPSPTPITDPDGDGLASASDNCPFWYNPTQVLPPWPYIGNDPDCDGFPSNLESVIGTDLLVQCPVGGTPDAWPPDFNQSGVVNITDVLALKPVIQQSVPPASPRFDLNDSGVINITDVLAIKPFIQQSCTP